ncbi:MAG: ATP-dependent helicase HrpB [Acidobacteriota bacterium]|jgi:ATP-dependent helicase HrpB|nr:ATP-dependent helicase HrpB [Acidobacteriota bacterium]
MRTLVQTPLPIDPHIAELVAHVRAQRTAVIVAPPGSGKTTRVPPAMTALGRTILLQPRRIAARALARRIADEQRWSIGEEVGWQIRFERRFNDKTKLLVATEGILTARLQSDPLLTDFGVVILDEFHERSIHADLALALVQQAASSREDLAVIVMSATIDAAPVAAFLGGAKVFDIAAPRFPIEVRHRPNISVAAAVRELLPSAKGDVLCFLPGAREIDRAAGELANIDALVLPLHGSLDVDAQERALAPASRRKVILATNVAETSLTVEGVTDVVDSGLHKVLRFDPETAVDHLVLERIPLDSAQQRAGRAGRTAPGRATRLWDERDILRPQREPEVRRVDLAAPALDIVAWGGDPRTFEWFERPQESRIDAALALLEMLGAIDGRKLTPIGEQLRRFPLHPRLGRVLVAANGSDDAVEWCVALAESARRGANPQSARELASVARRVASGRYRQHVDDETMRRALLAGFPDRVAMRRESGWLLASGTGATLARDFVIGGDFIVVLDITGDTIRNAVAIEREWLTPTKRETVHAIDGGRVRAVERLWYHGILLREQQVRADANESARLLAQHAAIDPALLQRVAFAELSIDWPPIIEQAVAGRSRTDDVDLAAFLPYDLRRKLDSLAPQSLPLPSGRSTRLEYREDGSVIASAKLQELFGLAETPRIGPHRTPITLALLSPNGRPVQVTQDLRSFWNSTYAEVRKELRARYPKHPWPDDPWTATPTHRTKRR